MCVSVCVWIHSTNSEENVKPNKKNNVKKNTYKLSQTIVLSCVKMKEKRMQSEKNANQGMYIFQSENALFITVVPLLSDRGRHYGLF